MIKTAPNILPESIYNQRASRINLWLAYTYIELNIKLQHTQLKKFELGILYPYMFMATVAYRDYFRIPNVLYVIMECWKARIRNILRRVSISFHFDSSVEMQLMKGYFMKDFLYRELMLYYIVARKWIKYCIMRCR